MSFISSYLLATSNNESPLSYHKWCCLSTLSVLAGRRFWVKLGPFTYYPNFYTVLVGDPGVKKSAAMDVGKEMIRKVGGIPLAATSTTKEAITKEMSHEKFQGKRFFQNKNTGLLEEYNQLAIFATEFTTFLGVNPTGMLDFLTAIYTEKVFDEKFKNAGNAFFAGPFITMLACMTPETVKGYLKLNILTGGFARRTMFVWGNRGRPISRPGNTPEQQAAFEWCVNWGKAAQTRSGEFTLSPEAWTWYDKWYNDNYAAITDKSPNLQSYFTTKHEFMFKTGMLLALSESDDLVITAEHLDFLNRTFFFPVEEMMARVFEGAGINPNAAVAAQICRMLEAADMPMKRKKLQAIFGDQATSWNECNDTITHMCNVGRLASRNVNIDGVMIEFIGTPQALQIRTDSDLAASSLTKPTPQP